MTILLYLERVVQRKIIEVKQPAALLESVESLQIPFVYLLLGNSRVIPTKITLCYCRPSKN